MKNPEEFIKYIINFELNSSECKVNSNNAESNKKNENLSSKKKKTIIKSLDIHGNIIKKYINEFWTSKQRQCSSLHEISYRACFKAQLPRFFIKNLTDALDIVYDPFSGRGTTLIEAALLNRNIISNDINPLSQILAEPRIDLPKFNNVKKRINEIHFNYIKKADIDLSMFYHPKTESELVCLKNYLKLRKNEKKEDNIDKWIRMIATNRLTGHSKGFFSVYTLPPNQATSQESQKRINEKRNQKPQYKDVKKLILKKSKSLIRSLNEVERQNLANIAKSSVYLNKDARFTEEIDSNSIQLIVTSPPFLNIVQYSKDNWLRCWFNTINIEEIEKNLTIESNIDKWVEYMNVVFQEFYRIIKPNGWIAFEVGEVRKGKIKLDEYIVPIGYKNGFICKGILINSQNFTKTSNIWGINNNKQGTNTNRIVLFYKKT